MATSRLIDELLVRGEEDWVMAPQVVGIVIRAYGAVDDHELTRTSLAIIREVLVTELMEAGDVVTEAGFHPWDQVPELAFERIETGWYELGRLPDLGEICWLANTSTGDLRARVIGERRAGRAGGDSLRPDAHQDRQLGDPPWPG